MTTKNKLSNETESVVNSYSIMPELHGRFPRPSQRWLWLWRGRFRLQAYYRRLRTRKWITRIAGPQYRRSRHMIEIDITYLCNLTCLNCNRSVSQAPEALHMPLKMVRKFVDDSINTKKKWRRIRILGGEPTLHPEFSEIIEEFLRYKAIYKEAIIEVVTNGYGSKVKRVIKELPDTIMVDNSEKQGSVQPHFGPFNMAPIDDPHFSNASFSNGCSILHECGMGLTPMGYYPCAVAGGIDRILQQQIGGENLPDDSDDMLDKVDSLCRYCGRFQDGHFIPRSVRAPLEEAKMSSTWKRLYAQWEAPSSSE